MVRLALTILLVAPMAAALAGALSSAPLVLRRAPLSRLRHGLPILVESWQQADTATVFGRPRSAASDAGIDGDDDYCVSGRRSNWQPV